MLLMALLFSKALAREEKQFSIVINVLDTALITDASVKFEMIEQKLNSSSIKSSELYIFKLTGAKTKVSIPIKLGLTYGRITVISKSRKNLPLHVNNNLFIFEPEDNLSLSISASQASFSGKGSEKYNYLKNLSEEVLKKIKSDLINRYYAEGNFEQMIYEYIREIDSRFDTLDKRLKDLQPFLSRNAYMQIEADNQSRRKRRILGLIISRAINHADRRYDVAFAEIFTKLLANPEISSLEKDFLAQSYYYVDYLYERSHWKNILRHNPDLRSMNIPKFADLYKEIQSYPSDSIRDKLTLVTFYKNIKQKPEVVDYFSDALAKMSDNIFRKKLSTFESSVTRSAFAYALPDASGKIHHLKELRGKLVVLDFWFSGCMPCKFLAEAKKPILAKYNKNPNIAFVTVSVDGEAQKEAWLRNLQKEIYTSNEEINLLAPKGYNDEIVKHYNILSYPTLIVVSKDGKVITVSPPKPSLSEPGKTDAFIALIEKHL